MAMGKELEGIMNTSVANFTVMYYKLHRFHWLVEGPLFFGLHELYEKLYDEAAEHLDEFAERILARGGRPVCTLRGVMEAATLSEQGDEVTPESIGTTLATDYGNIVELLKKGIKASEAEEDYPTADLLTETIDKLEKHIWMIKQSLK